ncbi:hypothetical protein GGI02_002046 [Coemansia sp. RSA 2322]|nr:hypothetical protein GGI02_002046 [Coemansia sp. RSA 2322]
MTLYCCLMYWRVRSIRSSFNESREMAVVSSLSVLGLLISTIIQYVQPEYMLLMRYRILMTTISQLCVNFTWWSIMAVPIYNCLFNHQKYLLKWRAKLRDDGLQREYHVDSSTGMQPISDAIAPGQPASFNDKTPSTQAFYYSNESGARLVNPLDVGAAISISASSTISNH